MRGSGHLRRRGAVALVAAGLVAGATAISGAATRPANVDSVSWIAGGRLIAFNGWFGSWFGPSSRGARRWLMNADGSGARAVASRFASISPDGRLFVEPGVSGNDGLLVVRRVGGKRLRTFRLRTSTAQETGPASWSPDGRAIAVSVMTSDSELVFVADLRARSVRSLSKGRRSRDSFPSWWPDGRRIAFQTCGGPPSFECAVALIAPDGSHRRRLHAIEGRLDSLQWAPDAKSIAVLAPFGEVVGVTSDPNAERQRHGIYVMRTDGSAFRRIAATPPTYEGVHLAWSPDSRRIAFSDQTGISIACMNGRKQRQITIMGRSSHLSWTPSHRVLFANRHDIYTVVAGQRPVRVRF